MEEKRRRFEFGKFFYYFAFGGVCLVGLIILIVSLTIPHTIFFEVNGGTECEAIVTGGYETLNLPTPTKDGYNFEGWFFTAHFGEENEFKADHYKNSRLETDIKVYAKWALPRFDLSFNSNGGEAHDPIHTNGRETLTLPVPTRAGWVFDGWYFDNTTFAIKLNANHYVNLDFTADTTVYAKWLPDLTPVGIVVMGLKNTYNVGDVLDVSGATFKVEYANGSYSAPAAITPTMVVSFSASTAGTKTMYIIYMSFSLPYEYTVE